MGNHMAFLEVRRQEDRVETPESRVRHFGDFHVSLEEAERRKQASRCKDCGVPFCQISSSAPGMVSGCPLGNLIPEWNDLLCRGNYRHALQRLTRTDPFPEFTSRVCPGLCEEACTGNLTGKPVCNRENEKYLVELGFSEGWIRTDIPAIRSGKKVAVVGSGPAGLAAADRLNRRGHEVTVYERADRPGGLLMYGIPNMKLEKKIVLRRIRQMEEEGILFCTGTEISGQEQAEKLLREYDAVVLACGASSPRDTAVPGRSGEGVVFAVDYLTAAAKNLLDPQNKADRKMSARGKRVVVIGGGDTGTDCVATALRQGCKKVSQLIRRPEPPKERPADNLWPERSRALKTDYGQEEAAAVFGKDPRIFGRRVKEFLRKEDGKLTGLMTVQTVLKTGADSPLPPVLEDVPGSESRIPCEMVLLATGFSGADPGTAEAFGVKLSGSGRIETQHPRGYQTNVPKLFTAGDCRRGSSLVVWAIREGCEAAREVDEFLMGYTTL